MGGHICLKVQSAWPEVITKHRQDPTTKVSTGIYRILLFTLICCILHTHLTIYLFHSAGMLIAHYFCVRSKAKAKIAGLNCYTLYVFLPLFHPSTLSFILLHFACKKMTSELMNGEERVQKSVMGQSILL